MGVDTVAVIDGLLREVRTRRAIGRHALETLRALEQIEHSLHWERSGDPGEPDGADEAWAIATAALEKVKGGVPRSLPF